MCSYAKRELDAVGVAYEPGYNSDNSAMWAALNAIGHTGGVGIPVINCCNEILVQPGGSNGISMPDFLAKAATCANSHSGPPPPPTPAPAMSARGPCVLDAAGCVSSPNFPSNYGSNERCTIGPNFGTITVESFDTENNWDKLFVDGTTYMGSNGPAGVNAVGDITWNSDGSVSKKGWKICGPVPTPAPAPPAPAPSGPTPCTGPDCNIPGCTGDDCNIPGGPCTGPDCNIPGCTGDDCNIPGGPCTGPDCNIPGGPCTGPDCNIPGGPCTGPDCNIPGCTGDDCNVPGSGGQPNAVGPPGPAGPPGPPGPPGPNAGPGSS